MEKAVIAVTGYSGSGKSTLAGMLRDRCGCEGVGAGDVMRAGARKLGYARLSDMIALSGVESVFERFREPILQGILRRYRSESVVVDGLYDAVLADALMREVGRNGICIVSVVSDRRNRDINLAARYSLLGPGGAIEAARRDSVKVIAGLEKVVRMADLEVRNNGTLLRLGEEADMVAVRVLHGSQQVA